jgi:lipid-binding SYLF domain-containing protein
MLTVAFLAGPALAEKGERAQLRSDVAEAIASMRAAEPGIERFFKSSAGYVVFPRVGKGGFIFAGGHGDGQVIQNGKAVGFASVTIGTVGFQVGAQQFSEIIFFQNQAALDRFKRGKFELTAGVSIVVIKAGATNDVNYRDGVVVFAHPRVGAMAEAAIGAQKFNYKPGA